MNEEERNGGNLGPSGRFQRIEESLLRIEGKLDKKADLSALSKLEERVLTMEKGETPMARILLKQFDTLQTDVAELKKIKDSAVSVSQFKRWMLGTVVAMTGASYTIYVIATHLSLRR